MRKDKEKAVELRKIGKSYRAIREELGIPMSTLSEWFAGSEWSGEVRTKLLRSTSTQVSSMRALNEIRGKRLSEFYEKAGVQAERELETLRRDPLFVAGMMLYWNSGDKSSRDKVRFSNSDPAMVRFFLTFLKKTCQVPESKIRTSLLISQTMDETSSRRFWAFALGLPLQNFTKTAITKGKSAVMKGGELRYGMCTLIVSSTYLKVKVMEWLKILPKELLK